jgi:hypothetical protein
MTADVLPANVPGRCHEVLIKTGTFAITTSVTDAEGDRAAAQFGAEIS